MVHDIYSALVTDQQRNDLIVKDNQQVLSNGRSPLILTSRKEHLDCLARRLCGICRHIFVLKGGMGTKQRKQVAEGLSLVSPDEPRLILATGSYLGEGFDDARLDTLFLAMPVSWKGILHQYVGRLHRVYENKKEVLVYDYSDLLVPMFASVVLPANLDSQGLVF
jgi:superfamily II DNA or RNA helicase